MGKIHRKQQGSVKLFEISRTKDILYVHLAYVSAELKTHNDLQRYGAPETGAIGSVFKNIKHDFERPRCKRLFSINTFRLVAILRGNALMLKSDVFDYAKKLYYGALRLTFESLKKHSDLVDLNPIKHFQFAERLSSYFDRSIAIAKTTRTYEELYDLVLIYRFFHVGDAV